MKVILASASPRRREILASLGVPFTVVSANADEHSTETDPGKLTELLARRKAEEVRLRLMTEGTLTPDTLILASDTVVASPDGEILGKPRDRADASRMLRALSGRRHTVVSSIALLLSDRAVSAHEVTEVEFDEIPEKLLTAYLDSPEPYDKAGAYAIQGEASVWIRGIRGDYFNVVGLPVHLLSETVRNFTGKELCEL